MELAFAPVLTLCSLLLLAWCLVTRPRGGVVERVRQYANQELTVPQSASPGFAQRVLLPGLAALGRELAARSPVGARARLTKLLDAAGAPVSLNTVFVLRGAGMVAIPLVFVAAMHFIGQTFDATQAALGLVLFSVGGYVPKFWLTGRARKRQQAIQRGLPDALDLIVVSMEAGLAFDGALSTVVAKTRGPLRDEFQRTLREIELGVSRRDGFRHLAARTQVKELTSLINAVIQADQMGVSMAAVMRAQASESRLHRRQRAEETAHQAAVKMLLPLVIFILPSVMIVTVGPAVIAIYSQFSKGIFS